MGESVALLTMNFFFKQVKQPPLLGVDIGTGSIKVVKLQKYLSSKIFPL